MWHRLTYLGMLFCLFLLFIYLENMLISTEGTVPDISNIFEWGFPILLCNDDARTKKMIYTIVWPGF